MAAYIEWSIEGKQELSRNLRALSLSMDDWKEALGNAADLLTRTFSEDVFSTKGAAVGARWKPLSPATIARKARSGQSTDPLVGSGAMKSSFTSQVTSKMAVISNPVSYFKYHQSNRPRTGKLPRRVMMRLGQMQREQVVKEFQKVWIDKIKKA
jgi:phage gpG-like protein